jgi:hypothetical protein
MDHEAGIQFEFTPIYGLNNGFFRISIFLFSIIKLFTGIKPGQTYQNA